VRAGWKWKCREGYFWRERGEGPSREEFERLEETEIHVYQILFNTTGVIIHNIGSSISQPFQKKCEDFREEQVPLYSHYEIRTLRSSRRQG
jgi:hypothetical protein